jgi:hypothetical protein
LLASVAFQVACGYHWTSPEERPSISIPFVIGDEDGALTQELIWAFSRSALAQIANRDARYRLEVQIVEAKNDTVGFRRDKQLIKGKTRKNLLACEGRRAIAVDVTLLQRDEIVVGPFRVAADADYDYVDGDSVQDLTFTDSQGQFVTVLPFSLGQLEPIESAQEAATRPLYRSLAQKIVDVLSTHF